MPEIPAEYQRVREHQVEAIIYKHLSILSSLSNLSLAARRKASPRSQGPCHFPFRADDPA
jgi:hypothetical protein